MGGAGFLLGDLGDSMMEVAPGGRERSRAVTLQIPYQTQATSNHRVAVLWTSTPRSSCSDANARPFYEQIRPKFPHISQSQACKVLGASKAHAPLGAPPVAVALLRALSLATG